MLASAISFAIVFAAALAFRWLLRASGARIISDDTCAKCGYLVIGLPTNTCPECGSNLAAPGAILRKGAKAPMPRALAIIIWSIAFSAADIAVNAAWLGHLPTVSVHTSDGSFANPHSNAYTSIHFNYRGESYRGSPLSGHVKIILTDNNDHQHTYQADLIAGVFQPRTTLPQLPKSAKPLTTDAILKWMSNCGIDMTKPSTSDEANALFTSINGATTGKLISSSGFWSIGTSASQEFRQTYLVSAVQWTLIIFWACASLYLWRRRPQSNH